jgi:Flp pilus assembly protein TadB
MLIWSSLSLFGLLIVHRTLTECETLQIFSEQLMNRYRLFSFLTVVALNFLLRDFIFMLIALNIAIFLSPWWVPFLIQKHRESSLKKQFIPIVDGLILSMKSGKGFRPAVMTCGERSALTIQHTLKEFLSAIQYQKEIQSLSKDPKIVFFFQELMQVDQSAHKPVEKLKALRRRLVIEKNFRQKSRQALLQVRFQSWIISAMYLLVLGYVQHDFGLRTHLKLVLGSGFLFCIGLFVVQKMGRNYKWKI